MIAIIFDLELVKRFKKGQQSEIVEIGACKVDLLSKTITDDIQIYTLPERNYISKSTRKFIHMSVEDMKRAIPFKEGIERFCEWLPADYYLCSWGKDDRFHLINQCVRNQLDLSWFRNYNDIQRSIGRLLEPENKNQVGLQRALELAGMKQRGNAHRGIDDAINTARLFIRYMDQITLKKNILSPNELMKHQS